MGRSRQATYNMLGYTVSLFSQWLILMVIPLMSDFDDAGVFSIAVSICSILNLVATLSLHNYQVADRYERYSENAYRMCRLTAMSVSFLCIPVIVFMLDYDLEQGLVILFYMLYRNLIHAGWVYIATLQMKDKLDYSGKCMIVEGTISFASFAVLYVATQNLIVSTATMALIGGGTFLILILVGYRKYVGDTIKPLFEWEGVGALVKLGIPVMLSTLAPIVITAIPKILLQSDYGDAATGIFSTIASPAIVIPTLVESAFIPFIPSFSDAWKRNPSDFRRRSFILLLVILGFGVLCYITAVLLADPVFRWIYGEELADYTKYFSTLIIGITVYTVGVCSTTLLVIRGKSKYAVAMAFMALAVSLLVSPVMISDSGIEGATYSVVIAYAVFGLSLFICNHLTSYSKGSREV